MKDLIGQIEFWRGVGHVVVDLIILTIMYFTVMAVSGHQVKLRQPPATTRRISKADASFDTDEGDAAGQGTTTPRRRTNDRSSQHLAHLDLLANLKTSLQLQAATIVLIVLAVLLLAFNKILGGSEVATILSGITGYVLGRTHSSQSPVGGRESTDGADQAAHDGVDPKSKEPPEGGIRAQSKEAQPARRAPRAQQTPPAAKE